MGGGLFALLVKICDHDHMGNPFKVTRGCFFATSLISIRSLDDGSWRYMGDDDQIPAEHAVSKDQGIWTRSLICASVSGCVRYLNLTASVMRSASPRIL